MSPAQPIPTVRATLYRPTWADPGFALATTEDSRTDVVVLSGAPVQLVRPNPKRIALGFVVPFNQGVDFKLGPWSDVNVIGIIPPNTGTLVWYTLFEHGTIVCRDWWANTANTVTVRVIEIEIN